MNRTLLLGSAWTASAGAAVGLGFLAVSLVDASASPVVQPVATSSLEGTESSASTTPSVSPAPTGQQVTPGGTVFASCAGGSTVPVLSGAPAPGWWPDDSQDPGEFEFESATQSVEVHATCVGGVPQFVVEGPRADDHGRHGGDDGQRGGDGGTPAATPTSDAPDDSDGRAGGGHGADDGPGHDAGDDHGGGSNSGSGGSGSDDSGSGGHGSDD